ncbi:hypothetical protein D1115_02255 [Vibrio alfacsensis]|uniref:Uncharacterized protein n=1 Tax=Vibrio alfacsensis TaxID=1074311 RepID=A0ABN5PCR2_9VIBR|nr:hypothetical protein [Vibrio alfacsensis]AXY00246.1 hypothetical protein D1115_02255 [Vibrio alfacsensis]
MGKQYLEHRPGKPGHIEKWITDFSEVERIALEELSQEKMILIKDIYKAMPDILEKPELQFIVQRIKRYLKRFDSDIKLYWYYEYEGVPLTLDWYFRVVGELQNDCTYVGLAHDLNILILIAHKVAHGYPFSSECALAFLEAGIRSEEYYSYKKRYRVEPLNDNVDLVRAGTKVKQNKY